MGTEASPAELAAFTKVLEDIDQRNQQRLFYRLFPDEGVTEPDGSVSHYYRDRDDPPALTRISRRRPYGGHLSTRECA